tara:strand:- start:442 stop:3783 length:3342 start_codon:yes stop_codon:yes gene_type:complete
MLSNLTNEPAFVNLALIGGSGEQYVESLKMGEILNKFKYELMSENGKNSYTYTIELINANESLTDSLLSLYSSTLASNSSVNLLAQSLNTTESLDIATPALFPKLLVQWGYNAHDKDARGVEISDADRDITMSRIHLAQISNIEYKFTQDNEKILIITAVDTSDASRIFTSNEVRTPNIKTPIDITYGYEEIVGTTKHYSKHHINFSTPDGVDTSFTNIILEQIASLLRVVPGLTPVVFEVPRENDTYMSKLLDGIYSRAFINNKAMDHQNEYRNRTKGIKYKTPMLDPNVYQTPEQLIINLGEEVGEKFEDGMGPGALGEWYKSAQILTRYIGSTMYNEIPDDIEKQGLISVTKEHNFKVGGYGYSTDVLAPDQLTKDADLTKIHAAAEPIVMGPLTPVFRYGEGFGSNGVLAIDSLILSAVDKFMGLNNDPVLQAELILNSELRLPIRSENMDRLWWEDTPSQPIKSYMFLATSPAGEHASLAITLEDGRVFQTYRGKELSDILRSVMESFRDAGQYFDNEPVTDQRLLFPSLYIHVNYYPFRGVSPPNAQITHWCEDLLHLKEKAKEELFDEGLKDVFTQAYIDENDLTNLSEDSFNFAEKYEDLEPSEKEDLHHSFNFTYTKSPKGETVMDTALKMITKYNSLVVKKSEKIGIMYTPESYTGNFKDRVDDFKKGKITPRGDIAYIGRMPELTQGAGNSLRHIPGQQPGTISLKYAKGQTDNKNIVKFFDFKSDNRYLGNLMSSILTLRTLKEYSQTLSYDNIASRFIGWRDTLRYILELVGNSDAEFSQIQKDSITYLATLMNEGANTAGISFTANQHKSFEDVRDVIDSLIYEGELDLSIAPSHTHGGAPTLWDDYASLYIFLQAVVSPVMMGHLFQEDPRNPHDAIYEMNKREFIMDNFYKSNTYMLSMTPDDVYDPAWYNLYERTKTVFRGRAPLTWHKAESEKEVTLSDYKFEGTAPLPDIVSKAQNYLIKQYDTPSKTYNDSLVYVLKGHNAFDDAINSNMKDDLALQLQFFMKNIQQVLEVRVKTLGLPFIDTHLEISYPRVVKFDVEDLTPSNNSKNLIKEYASGSHWLSGAYRPIAISHEIDINGYTTEFKLLKAYGSTTL